MFIKDLLKKEDKVFIAPTNIGGREYNNSLTSLVSSRIKIPLQKKYNSFICSVGVDDISNEETLVDFLVYADDKLVDVIKNVSKKQTQDIQVNIYGANILTLEIRSKRKMQASWIEPKVYSDFISDLHCPISNIQVKYPKSPDKYNNCVVTVLTNDMVIYFNEMIKSLKKYNDLTNTKCVVLGFNLNIDTKKIVEDNDCLLIECNAIDNIRNTGYKTILPILPYIVLADKYMYLDCDCLVCAEIFHLFDVIDILDSGSIMAVRHGDKDTIHTFKDALLNKENYDSNRQYIDNLGLSTQEQYFNGIINTGFFVCSDYTLLSLNHAIKTFMPQIKRWVDEESTYNVREEGAIIAGLAKMNVATLLDESYNFQVHLYADDLLSKIIVNDGSVLYENKKIKILHFTGLTKQLYYEKILRMMG